MPYEMLVGLLVTDDDRYARYREEISPILEEHGGGFRYDFRVSEVLRTRAQHDINRVFAIFFESEDAADRFFSNERYLEIKDRLFEGAVMGTTVIAAYRRPAD